MGEKVKLQQGDLLLVVDVQNDFLPGGTLAVPHGDEVVPVLNTYLNLFSVNHLPVYASRDWHPANHCSFKEQGGLWPPHCVQHSPGAGFAEALQLPSQVVIISKAANQAEDAYSVFQGTGLSELMKAAGITRLFVGGLATDYCVLATVMDALAAGFQVNLLTDAIRAVELQYGDGERAKQEMAEQGAKLIELSELSV